MSRTVKGSKGCGYDFWSRRPHSGNGHGKWAKLFSHRVERRQADQIVRNELKNL